MFFCLNFFFSSCARTSPVIDISQLSLRQSIYVCWFFNDYTPMTSPYRIFELLSNRIHLLFIQLLISRSFSHPPCTAMCLLHSTGNTTCFYVWSLTCWPDQSFAILLIEMNTNKLYAIFLNDENSGNIFYFFSTLTQRSNKKNGKMVQGRNEKIWPKYLPEGENAFCVHIKFQLCS